MMENQFSSQLLDNAVDELAKLPGVGRKTALRLALHLLRQTPEAVDTFAQAVTHLRHDVKYCQVCHNTQQYNGRYHVLGGVISPMDGIGPADLAIDSLIQRVMAGDINEVILALSPTMEGDTTNFYISRKLAPYPVRLSVIARGISVGDELEYTDEVTLGRAILNRTVLQANPITP